MRKKNFLCKKISFSCRKSKKKNLGCAMTSIAHTEPMCAFLIADISEVIVNKKEKQ